MKLNRTLIALGLAAAFAGQAQALVYTGTTSGGPTWTRPIAGNPPTPPVSGVGVGVNYSAQLFSVAASGLYTFLSTATNPAAWDNYTFLYRTSFNPTAQFTNVLIGDDDGPSFTIGQSGFSYALTAGTQYIFVTTGFAPGDAGAFSNSITGPGNVILGAVPEPESYALMALGLAGLLVAARRKSTSTQA